MVAPKVGADRGSSLPVLCVARPARPASARWMSRWSESPTTVPPASFEGRESGSRVPGKVDCNTAVSSRYNLEIAEYAARMKEGGRSTPLLVGFLASEDEGGAVYARMTKRACEKNGLGFDLRVVDRVVLEAGVMAANADPAVHGIIIYYPVFGGAIDDYLRDVVSVEKDVEGLHHRYRYAMYHNIRTLDNAGLGGQLPGSADLKCILPCTPLAVVKILESLEAYDASKLVGRQLVGRTAIVYNRSEVVGRPLAAMLANDGALVYSVDEHGTLLYIWTLS